MRKAYSIMHHAITDLELAGVFVARCRRHVPLPVNWKTFIDLSDSEGELEHFLSVKLIARAKATLLDCEVVTSGGFIERNEAQSLPTRPSLVQHIERVQYQNLV